MSVRQRVAILRAIRDGARFFCARRYVGAMIRCRCQRASRGARVAYGDVYVVDDGCVRARQERDCASATGAPDGARVDLCRDMPR